MTSNCHKVKCREICSITIILDSGNLWKLNVERIQLPHEQWDFLCENSFLTILKLKLLSQPHIFFFYVNVFISGKFNRFLQLQPGFLYIDLKFLTRIMRM